MVAHTELEGEDLQEVDLGKLYDTVVKPVGKAIGGAVTKVLQPANNSPENPAGKRKLMQEWVSVDLKMLNNRVLQIKLLRL